MLMKLHALISIVQRISLLVESKLSSIWNISNYNIHFHDNFQKFNNNDNCKDTDAVRSQSTSKRISHTSLESGNVSKNKQISFELSFKRDQGVGKLNVQQQPVSYTPTSDCNATRKSSSRQPKTEIGAILCNALNLSRPSSLISNSLRQPVANTQQRGC